MSGSPDARGWRGLPHWLEAPLGTITKKLEAFVYRGTPEESLEAAEDILRRQIQIFGPDGGPTAVGRADVAKKLEDLGRLDEARLLRKEVVAGYKRHLGDEHIYTLNAELALGINLKKSGMSDEARDLFIHVYEERTRILGPDDEETWTASLWLSSLDHGD